MVYQIDSGAGFGVMEGAGRGDFVRLEVLFRCMLSYTENRDRRCNAGLLALGP